MLVKILSNASGILFCWRDNSSFRCYTLGPLCLWQCLWYCPSICDFGHSQSVIELFGKQVNNALSVHLITRRQRNHKNLSFARLCASLMPVLLSKKRPSFYKNKPVWRIVNTGFAFKQILLRWEQLAQLWETLFKFFYWTWIFQRTQTTGWLNKLDIHPKSSAGPSTLCNVPRLNEKKTFSLGRGRSFKDSPHSAASSFLFLFIFRISSKYPFPFR